MRSTEVDGFEGGFVRPAGGKAHDRLADRWQRKEMAADRSERARLGDVDRALRIGAWRFPITEKIDPGAPVAAGGIGEPLLLETVADSGRSAARRGRSDRGR